MINRRTTNKVETDLRVAALLRSAGVPVDQTADWSAQISTAARITADRNVARAVIGRFLAGCGIPADRQAKLTDQILKETGR